MTEQELEKKLSNVYRRASEETRQKLEDYTKTFERLDVQKKATLSEADYKEWRKRQITTGKRWEAVSNSLAMDVLKADNEARDIINDFVPEAFADGYNFSCYQMAREMGDNYVKGTFTLYDKKAVERLVRDNPDLLPQLKENSKTAEDIRTGKIIRWNKEKINSEVTQGIIQGESIGKIAKRMENVVGMEERSAIRNARTATNGARNAGKEESFEDAEELGIEVLQMWVASVDDRTRYEHRQLDGQTVKTGEKFHVDGFEIAYPCDPTADPSMVYNCRCTIIPYLPKYNKEKPDPHPNVSDKDYEAWKSEHSYKGEEEKTKEPAYTIYATTKEEAKEVLKNIGFSTIRGADYMDDELFINNANQIATLEDRFKALDIEGVTMNIREFPASKDGEYAYVNPKGTALNINTDYFSDADDLRSSVEVQTTDREEDGRMMSMPVSEAYYDTAVLTHEYGHIVQKTICEDFGIEKERDGKYTEEYLQWTKDVSNEIFGIVQDNNPDKDPLELWKEQVSTYAEVNTQEFFAECFMNAYCGEPNEFGKAIDEWLTEHGYGQKAEKEEPVKESEPVKEEKTVVPELNFGTKKFEDEKDATEYFLGKFKGYNRFGIDVKPDKNAPATKWGKALSEDEEDAIGGYTGDSYKPVNNYLRDQWSATRAEKDLTTATGDDPEYGIEEFIGYMDSGISKFELEEPITVYRTCEREFVNELKVGNVFHDEGYGSTSVINEKMASGDVFIEINVPAGKGVGAYVDSISVKSGEEFEFLLARGADYAITEKVKRKDGIYVKATVIGFTPKDV